MADRPLILLMTRPAEMGVRFVQSLAPEVSARMEVCASPLIGITPSDVPVDPGDARGLIFTSVHGVAAAAALMGARDLPCHCVGTTTTQAARDAGWSHARVAGLDAEELIATLLADPPPGPLLHLHGTHASGNAAARLTEGGVTTRETVVYDQPELTLTDAARGHLAGRRPVLAPLFSPRSARLFAQQYSGTAPLHVQVISEAVARELEGVPVATLDIANEPTGADMRSLVERRAMRTEGDSETQ